MNVVFTLPLSLETTGFSVVVEDETMRQRAFTLEFIAALQHECNLRAEMARHDTRQFSSPVSGYRAIMRPRSLGELIMLSPVVERPYGRMDESGVNA